MADEPLGSGHEDEDGDASTPFDNPFFLPGSEGLVGHRSTIAARPAPGHRARPGVD